MSMEVDMVLVGVEVAALGLVVVEERNVSGVGNLVIGQGSVRLVVVVAGFLQGIVVEVVLVGMIVMEVVGLARVVDMVTVIEVLIMRGNVMAVIAMVTAMAEMVAVVMSEIMVVVVLVMEVVGQRVMKEVTEIVQGLTIVPLDVHLMMIVIKNKWLSFLDTCMLAL